MVTTGQHTGIIWFRSYNEVNIFGIVTSWNNDSFIIIVGNKLTDIMTKIGDWYYDSFMLRVDTMWITD